MSRSTTHLLVLGCLAFGVVGCGSEDEGTDSTAAASADDTVTAPDGTAAATDTGSSADTGDLADDPANEFGDPLCDEVLAPGAEPPTDELIAENGGVPCFSPSSGPLLLAVTEYECSDGVVLSTTTLGVWRAGGLVQEIAFDDQGVSDPEASCAG